MGHFRGSTAQACGDHSRLAEQPAVRDVCVAAIIGAVCFRLGMRVGTFAGWYLVISSLAIYYWYQCRIYIYILYTLYTYIYIYIHCIYIYISIPTWISFYVKVEHLYFSGLKCPYWLVILPSLLLSCWDSTWEVPTWPPPAMWSSYIPCWHRMRSEPWGMRCRSEEKWWPLPSGKRSHNYGLNHHAINGKINYFDWAID